MSLLSRMAAAAASPEAAALIGTVLTDPGPGRPDPSGQPRLGLSGPGTSAARMFLPAPGARTAAP
ncbi:hypothetical protein, partial [Streptomyces sp.]|uniref:hypothetical protein n=1 Tax=Streptomyces sp. TaxID=1931 RepID=UPI002F93EF04